MSKAHNAHPSQILANFIKQTRTSFFGPLNGLERVHLLVMELKHPILGFE